MNAGRRRREQVIYEENEEYRICDRALGYPSIDGSRLIEEAVDSNGNRPIRVEAINPFHLDVVETKHRQFSKKKFCVRRNKKP